jgi:hypothetical protein
MHLLRTQRALHQHTFLRKRGCCACVYVDAIDTGAQQHVEQMAGHLMFRFGLQWKVAM